MKITYKTQRPYKSFEGAIVLIFGNNIFFSLMSIPKIEMSRLLQNIRNE